MLRAFDRAERIPSGRIVVAVAAVHGDPFLVTNVLASLTVDGAPAFEPVEFEVSADDVGLSALETGLTAGGFHSLGATFRALLPVRASRVADAMVARARTQGGGIVQLYDTGENDEIIVRGDRSIHHVVDGALDLVAGSGDIAGGTGRGLTEIGDRLDEVGAGLGEAGAGLAGAAGNAGRGLESLGGIGILAVLALGAYVVLK